MVLTCVSELFPVVSVRQIGPGLGADQTSEEETLPFENRCPFLVLVPSQVNHGAVQVNVNANVLSG